MPRVVFDSNGTRYVGVFGLADYESEQLKIQKYKMADHNGNNLSMRIKPVSREFLRSLIMNLESKFRNSKRRFKARFRLRSPIFGILSVI